MARSVLLQTSRLTLRQFTADDGPSLVELDSDPEVMRFLSKGQPTPPEEIHERVLPHFLGWHAQGERQGFWAIETREPAEFIGWIHLRPDKITPHEMELGYRLRRAAWGLGYASEAAGALLDKAFGEWGLERVVARCLAGHSASRRVMEKLGMGLEEAFVYPQEMLAGWTEEERAAVKYSRDAGA